MEELFLFQNAVSQNLKGLATESRKQAGMPLLWSQGCFLFPSEKETAKIQINCQLSSRDAVAQGRAQTQCSTGTAQHHWEISVGAMG